MYLSIRYLLPRAYFCSVGVQRELIAVHLYQKVINTFLNTYWEKSQ